MDCKLMQRSITFLSDILQVSKNDLGYAKATYLSRELETFDALSSQIALRPTERNASAQNFFFYKRNAFNAYSEELLREK